LKDRGLPTLAAPRWMMLLLTALALSVAAASTAKAMDFLKSDVVFMVLNSV
jgi:hypothetical protein